MLVDQRGGQFDLERFFFQKVDESGPVRWASRPSARTPPAAASRRVSISYWLGSAYFTSVGRDPDFAQQVPARRASPSSGDDSANLLDQLSQRVLVHVVCRRVAACFSSSPKLADFLVGMRKQVRDLVLERAGVDDLAQRGVGRQRQQVAGDVEGAGPQRALVGLLLHRRRAWA